MASKSFPLRYPVSGIAKSLLGQLKDRGVVEIGGQFFSGDSGLGQPPEGSLSSTFVMAPTACPLLPGECAAAVTAIRDEVLGFAERLTDTAPITGTLLHARYCVRPAVGIDCDIELLGLVDRIVRISLF
ncbi:MAG: hypothetical protein K8S94_15540 [Planctomycetia bacterium]|nr:hypothetical protein [Planctomycetia bacterium]